MPRSREGTGGMGKRAKATADKVNEELAVKEAAVVLRTSADLAALRPRVSDKASFDKLVAAVELANRRNESVAQFKQRVTSLGHEVVAVARRVAGLLPV